MSAQAVETAPLRKTPLNDLHLRLGARMVPFAGYLMPLHLFFPPRHPWKRQLLQFAAEEIQRQEEAGMARYHPHWRRQLRKSFNARNYYLTEGGLVFFYPMFAIAPAPERIPTFCLPNGAAGLLLPGNDAKTP